MKGIFVYPKGKKVQARKRPQVKIDLFLQKCSYSTYIHEGINRNSRHMYH
jgi:hypothetical protein